VSRLLSVLHKLGTTVLDGATYTYDGAGNRLTKVDQRTATQFNYSYDHIYQLGQVTQGTARKPPVTESYTYDLVGNRLSSLGVSPYTYNASNELTATPSGNYTYDANGNEKSKPDGTTYTWDFENRLTQAVLPGTGGTVTFKYDPFGRRVQKSFTQGSTTTTTNYVGDDLNLIEELDNNGNVLARFTSTENLDEPLSEIVSGTTSYYEQDALGSITSLTNPSATIAASYGYDAFGNLSTSSGSLTNSFRYTGRELDPETKLYNYRTRYYDPTIGRFTREDAIRFGSGDPNFYNYVGGNPVLYTDPSGRWRVPGMNWCGPNWTGGLPEEYNPAHKDLYKDPKNRYDRVCMHHDICYFNCRSGHPCDPNGRVDCFKTCDQIFVGEMPGWLNPGPYLLAAGIYWHRQWGPDPEMNRPDLRPGGCGCGGSR